MAFDKYPAKVLEPLKNYLTAQRNQLVKQLKELEESDPYNQPDRTNDNELGEDSYESNEHDQIVALKDQILASLKEVEETLERIKQGSYGFCLNCHQMINTDRLAIKPTAKLCIACERQKTA